MSIVVVSYYQAQCEQCSRTTLVPTATEAAAHLTFDTYLGVSLPDGRNLCHDHLGALTVCSADREHGEHEPDPDEPAMCLFCGWPVQP